MAANTAFAQPEANNSLNQSTPPIHPKKEGEISENQRGGAWFLFALFAFAVGHSVKWLPQKFPVQQK